jgi:hypothetical protein
LAVVTSARAATATCLAGDAVSAGTVATASRIADVVAGTVATHFRYCHRRRTAAGPKAGKGRALAAPILYVYSWSIIRQGTFTFSCLHIATLRLLILAFMARLKSLIYIYINFFSFFFGAPRSISYFIFT